MSDYIKMVDGVEVPMTAEEIAARQAEENTTPPLSLLDQLTAIFTSLDEDTQADLGPLAAAVFMFLEKGNPGAAKKVIVRAQIPAELETLRSQLLAVFG